MTSLVAVNARNEKVGLDAHFLFLESVLMDIQALCAKTLKGLGYELMDVEYVGHHNIRVIANRHPSGITVDDCANISRHLTHVFAAEKIDYKSLEVSSPGLDRALKNRNDFVQSLGKLVCIKTKLPNQEAVQKIIARLESIEGEELILETQNTKMRVALGNVRYANLEPEF